MNKEKLRDALNKCPVIVPKFKVVRVPKWSTAVVHKGDILYMIDGSFRPKKWGGGGINMGASFVEFVGYTDVSDWLDENMLFVGTTLHKRA